MISDKVMSPDEVKEKGLAKFSSRVSLENQLRFWKLLFYLVKRDDILSY